MFPRGNREGQNTAMSLYLNAADAEAAPVGWNRRASFKLTIVNHLNPEQSIAKGLCSCCATACYVDVWQYCWNDVLKLRTGAIYVSACHDQLVPSASL